MPKLETAALPKGTAGRRAKEIDSDFASALVSALKETPTVEYEGDTRPNTVGSSDLFPTKGRASSDGRRYANVINKEIPNTKVRVTVVTVKEKDKPDVFKWRVYIPLSAQTTEGAA